MCQKQSTSFEDCSIEQINYLALMAFIFRLAGGLVWLGILAFGVISEQVKTRLEDRAAEEGTKVCTKDSYISNRLYGTEPGETCKNMFSTKRDWSHRLRSLYLQNDYRDLTLKAVLSQRKLTSQYSFFMIVQPHLERSSFCIMQDVEDAKEVDLGQGLMFKDVRVGGGPAVQQGYLTVLHYK